MSKNTGFSSTSANRYSLALYELASESNLVSQIEEQAIALINLIKSSNDFNNFIKDPTSNKDNLITVISKISEQNKLDNLFKNFLNFLITKRRFFFVEQILKSFVETCSKKRG